MTSTYTTLGDGLIQTMWRDNIPKLGFTYPFVLRLILAMAGRPLQRLQPSEMSSHYADIAKNHFAIALPEIMHLLPHLNVENCQALYISSILICLYFFF